MITYRAIAIRQEVFARIKVFFTTHKTERLKPNYGE